MTARAEVDDVGGASVSRVVPVADEAFALASATASAVGEAAHVALVAVGVDGALLLHDERFDLLCGLPPGATRWDELQVMLDWIEGHGSETARAIGALLRAREDQGSGTLELAGGRTLEWSRAPIVHQARRLGHAWALYDASESEQLARALRDAESWLRMLEAHEAGVLLELDAERRIVSIWGGGNCFERTDAELEGMRLCEALTGPSGMELDQLVLRVLESGQPEERECGVERSGRPRRVLLASARLLSSDGHEPRATLLLCDVTERARVQARLVRAERLVSVGLLAAGVAHEINNPLSYVLLNLHRLRSDLSDGGARPPRAPGEDMLRSLAMSIEGAERVQAIVRDLTAFSRDDSRPSLPVDVHAALEFSIRMATPEIRRRARLQQHRGAPPLVAGSETRLSQVFLNLLINAAHSIEEGAPSRNRIVVVTRADERGDAVIEVHDTGAGMSPGVIRQVFEPFYTSKPAGMGSGLGLTICHGIVTSLGGTIEAESEEGRGSVFRVTLPAAR